jgi:hypothetical protein
MTFITEEHNRCARCASSPPFRGYGKSGVKVPISFGKGNGYAGPTWSLSNQCYICEAIAVEVSSDDPNPRLVRPVRDEGSNAAVGDVKVPISFGKGNG